MKKSLKVFLGLSAFFALAVVIGWFLFQGSESTDDAQVVGRMVDVAARIQGQVVKVFVNNNMTIKKGDLVVQLDDAIEHVQVEEAQSDFDAAVASVRQATVGTKQASANFKAGQSTKNLALKNLIRALNLQKKDFLSQQALDEQRAQYDQAVANFEMIRADLRTFKRTPSLDAALAKLKKAKAALKQANLNLNYTLIYAPIAGIVANKNVEVGKNVNPNVPLISIVSLNDTWIVANYKEHKLRYMKPGQKVKIKTDIYGSKTFDGIVTNISPASGETFALLPPDNASGNFVKVTRRFPVRIDFNPRPVELMRQGMSVETTVKIN